MNFKRYLKEYIDASSNKEYDMMLSGWMPITPSLMDKFKIRYEPIYRVAGLNSPKTEKKYENKKKVFSGFTKGSLGISSGAISGDIYLYEKSGELNGEHFETKGMKTIQFVKVNGKWKMSSAAWSDEK